MPVSITDSEGDSGRPSIPRQPLGVPWPRARPDAQLLGHRSEGSPRTTKKLTSTSYINMGRGRPRRAPRRRAASTPAWTRDRITSASISARAATRWNVNLPVGVLVQRLTCSGD